MPNARFKAVLFDLDGTLVDTLQDIAAAVNRGLVGAGLAAHPLEAYRRFVGNGMQVMIRRAVGEHADKYEAVLAHYREDYPRNCLNETAPYPGIADLVHTLQEKGIRLAIVTNKPQNQTDIIVPHCFPGVSFEHVCGSRPDKPNKPDPTVTWEVLEAMGLSREEVLFVGDSDVDAQTGVNAGVTCVGVSWGFRGREELLAAGADYAVDSAEEILTIVFNNAR